VLKVSKILELTKSIKMHHKNAEIEKKTLLESIELMWLNADIQRKKEDYQIPEGADENILRIRQLLASAWFEDLKS